MASGYSDMSEIRKDGRYYGVEQKPPKINLLDEKPRRESLVEQQLRGRIVMPVLGQQQNQQDFTQQQQLQQNQPQQQVYNNQSSQVSYNYNTQPAGPSGAFGAAQVPRVVETTTIVETTSSSQYGGQNPNVQSDLAAGLAEKEAKLEHELTQFSQQQLGPWSRPQSSTLLGAGGAGYDQLRSPSAPVSRPTSRASSTRSATTEAELMEKTARLMQDVEEFERKPLKVQQLVIERRPREVNSLSARSLSPQQNMSSVHTAIITVPKHEVDNKSPMPFAFDNFTTCGVRGNIASVGAAEPERPYAPIFPIVKRTPSPTNRRM